jgi:hypothetical protein
MELKYMYTIGDGFCAGRLDDYPEYVTQGKIAGILKMRHGKFTVGYRSAP